jgi:glucose-6-phosphate isomerase
MYVDLGNGLASVASPGVSRESLERLDERVGRAHERIERGRKNEEFGYAALNLPQRTDAGAIERAVAPLEDCESVLTIGIGGSALGAATISEALGLTGTHVLDNVDPAWVRETLAGLDLAGTAVHVVSRSGTTAETLANFLIVREAFEGAGVDWTERTIVTTGERGPLRTLADRHDLPVLSVPEGVPGRFSALSSVGLVPAAIRGGDVEDVLAGAREGTGVGDIEGSLFETPAYAYGAATYALSERGAAINAMLPYAEGLERFAEWFAQLWAESLGKEGLGQLPARALGATDQHSQLQLYRAGPRNTMVTFVRPRERPELTIPDTDFEVLSYLGATGLKALIDAEFEATEASLAAAGRPSLRIEIDRLDARSVGALLYDMELACVLVGELMGVETFEQPAVEWGKRATRGLLGAEGEFPESEAVGEKNQLAVEPDR